MPAYPAFAFFSAPYPPYPLPRREGGDFRLFYARGFAPCIPGAGRGAALGKGANNAPGGGRAPYRAGLGGHPVPGGGRARLVVCLPCLCFTFLPPSPRPPSRREGGDQSFFMQGASPLASPGLSGARHWGRGRTTRPAGGRAPYGAGLGGHPGARRRACLLCRLPTLPLVYFSAPIPPTPYPAGMGRFFVCFARGYRPPPPGG